jgi:hypothetical protein
VAREDLERLWTDPAHWTMFGYNCPADPRVVVPKRMRALGWTINWAHPQAIPMLLLMMGIAVGPALMVVAVMVLASSTATGLSPAGSLLGFLSVLGAIGVSTIVIILLSIHLSRGE